MTVDISRHPPHPENVPGDFYVEENCCLRCEVPFIAAPDLFGVDKADTQCIVKRQPATADELQRMYDAIARAELDCIRYKGSDRVIMIRGHEAAIGIGPASSHEPPHAVRPGWWARLRVRFRLK